MAVELRWVSAQDAADVVAAAHLFDAPPTRELIDLFLSRPGHHLCLAWVDGMPAGFVSGVETTHPDKGTEMFLYELGVDERFRRRGIGRALVGALGERARELGCTGMFVLTDASNDAAVGTYRSAGAPAPTDHVMFEWTWP